MDKFSIDEPQRQLAALPDRLRLPLAIDADAAAAEVATLPEGAWVPHFVPEHYRGSWSAVPLRAPRGAVHPILQISSPPDCVDWVGTPHLAACPAIAGFLDTMRSPLRSARLMRLGSGSAIFEHRDHDLSAEFAMARLHLPLTTNAGAEFVVNDRPVAMERGECWYLRLADPHRVVNDGTDDRINLVVDTAINDWLAQILLYAAA